MFLELLTVISIFASIITFKSIIIRINLFVFAYPIFIMFLMKQGTKMSGIMSIMFDRYDQYLDTAYYWSVLGYIVLILVIWPVRKKRLSIKRLDITEGSRFILIILLLLLGIIVWPEAFGIYGYGRFNLLPGGAWSGLYTLVSSLLILSSKGLSSWSSRLHLALCLFIIFRGERVDNLVVVLALFTLSPTEGGIIKETNKVIRFAIIAFPFMIIVSLIRIVQILGLKTVLDNWLFYATATLYKQHTALDVTHVYLSAVAYFHEMPSKWYALFNSVLSMISLNSNKLDYVFITKEIIPNAGGGIFYSEGVLAFGVFGVIVYSAFFGIALRYGIKGESLFAKSIIVLLLLLCFRFQWYGGIYIMKLLWLLPISILIFRYFTWKAKKYEKSTGLS